MKIPVHFTQKIELLIRGGYKAKHGKILDESIHTLRYEDLPEYIKLGKRVRRRQAVGDFFESWGTVIMWVLLIGGFLGWQAYNNHQKELEKQERINASYQQFKDSKSSIYQAEICPITTCNDGSCSSSTGRGTCSHHGGVRHY